MRYYKQNIILLAPRRDVLRHEVLVVFRGICDAPGHSEIPDFEFAIFVDQQIAGFQVPAKTESWRLNVRNEAYG